jgi:hypothetical protein
MDDSDRGSETLAQEALAEYFRILREWSLNGRSDTGLAPDSPQQP